MSERMWEVTKYGEDVCLRCGQPPELWTPEFEKTGICVECWQPADELPEDSEEEQS